MQTEFVFSESRLVAGVDEAGRGPLAGPVVAAAVILSEATTPDGLADSKQLGEAERATLAGDIRQSAVAWSVAWADRAEIDAVNILNATLLAMRRAIIGLRVSPGAVLVDGNRLPDLRFNGRQIDGQAIVRGDALVPAISAASIIAKTTRDAIMQERDALYPAYAFGRHKGYGTALHRERLAEHGPCDEHRRSFSPLKELMQV
jgi:ribonuclease HII